MELAVYVLLGLFGGAVASFFSFGVWVISGERDQMSVTTTDYGEE